MPATAKPLNSFPHQLAGLEGLFNQHYQQIYRTAYRITGTAEDAEDVLQTVFLRLVRRHDIDLSPNPTSYLIRATLNAAIDLVRSRRHHPSIQLDKIDLDAFISNQQDPETEQTDLEMRRAVRQAIASLSENSAELLILRYFEGYNNQEIAKILGMSQLVVGVLLHRARTRLRKVIGKFLEGHYEA